MECFLISLLGILLFSALVKDWCLVKKFLWGLEGEARGELSEKARPGSHLEAALGTRAHGDTEPWSRALLPGPGASGPCLRLQETPPRESLLASSPAKREAAWATAVKSSWLRVSFLGFALLPLEAPGRMQR